MLCQARPHRCCSCVYAAPALARTHMGPPGENFDWGAGGQQAPRTSQPASRWRRARSDLASSPALLSLCLIATPYPPASEEKAAARRVWVESGLGEVLAHDATRTEDPRRGGGGGMISTQAGMMMVASEMMVASGWNPTVRHVMMRVASIMLDHNHTYVMVASESH